MLNKILISMVLLFLKWLTLILVPALSVVNCSQGKSYPTGSKRVNRNSICFILDCVYEFITNPSKMLSCNPVGSQLQMHCAVSGPAKPLFKLHWYRGSRDEHGTAELLDSLPEYSTVSGAIEGSSETSGGKRRTISSVLRTVPILDSYSDQCFWCQIEVDSVEVSLYNYKHKFCLNSSKELSALSPCGDIIVAANMQVFCVTLEDIKDAFRASSEVTRVNVSSQQVGNVLISPTSSHSTSSLSPSQPMISTNPSTSLFSLSTVVSQDISPTLVPFPTVGAVEIPSMTDPPSSSTMSVTAGLLVAIAICLVFLIAIVILTFITLCLYRNRCLFFLMKKKEDSEMSESELDKTWSLQVILTL